MKKIQSRKIQDQSVTIPGSKSISHRMMICAALASGTSAITNVLESEDVLLTITALKSMGAMIERTGDAAYTVIGFNGCPGTPDAPVYLGNSGTSMRLLAGIAALGTGRFILTGDRRMCERPMKEMLSALESVNIKAVSKNPDGTPPVVIHGGDRSGGTVSIDCSRSSQYLSSLLMVGALFSNGLHIHLPEKPVSSPYIQLTMNIMKKFSVNAVQFNPVHYHVAGNQPYQPGDHHVEPDVSNAGYFWAAGAVTGQAVFVSNITPASLQGDLELIYLLEKMGCDLLISDNRIGIRGNDLAGIHADMSKIPDAVPALAVVAAFAKGETVISNIGHLREKECDRIHAVVSQLNKMGIAATQGDDFIRIIGGTPRHAVIETFNDHRIAMAFSIAGLITENVVIENPGCVAKSFPNFWDVFDSL